MRYGRDRLHGLLHFDVNGGVGSASRNCGSRGSAGYRHSWCRMRWDGGQKPAAQDSIKIKVTSGYKTSYPAQRLGALYHIYPRGGGHPPATAAVLEWAQGYCVSGPEGLRCHQVRQVAWPPEAGTGRELYLAYDCSSKRGVKLRSGYRVRIMCVLRQQQHR